MRIIPITREGLTSLIAERCLTGEDYVRVAIDGPEPAGGDDLAYRLIEELRTLGRDVLHVRTRDFLRPASLRFENGRTSPESFYYHWVNTETLNREVLERVHTGQILPTFWNPDTDRATRAGYVHLGRPGVVIVTGELLLGSELVFDVTVHLDMAPAALARRLDPGLAWTLPAFAQYADEVNPATFADVVVRMNDPAHPALVAS